MYHAIVRRKVRRGFAQFSPANPAAVLEPAAPRIHHRFAGDHALGGERHTREALERWFARLARLTPLEVELRQVVSGGWPWSTWVAMAWTARVTPAAGPPYDNEGTIWMHLRWGRLVALHEYLDSQRVAEACRTMAEAGIEEAAAAPIADR